MTSGTATDKQVFEPLCPSSACIHRNEGRAVTPLFHAIDKIIDRIEFHWQPPPFLSRQYLCILREYPDIAFLDMTEKPVVNGDNRCQAAGTDPHPVKKRDRLHSCSGSFNLAHDEGPSTAQRFDQAVPIPRLCICRWVLAKERIKLTMPLIFVPAY